MISGPVRLRRFHTTDVENILELDSDPEVHRYLFREPPTRPRVQNETLPDIIAHYDLFPGFGQWAAELAGSGRFIGWFSLYVSTPSELRRPELGYRLRPEHWGRGLASTVSIQLVDWAFAVLGVDTVRAETMAVNLASRRVMAKPGYVTSAHSTSTSTIRYPALTPAKSNTPSTAMTGSLGTHPPTPDLVPLSVVTRGAPGSGLPRAKRPPATCGVSIEDPSLATRRRPVRAVEKHHLPSDTRTPAGHPPPWSGFRSSQADRRSAKPVVKRAA